MASDKIQNLDNDSFDAAITGTDTPVLVDFWAPWCGPCKAIAPILEELADEMDGKVSICKVDVDNNSELAGKFNIRAIPTMLLFKGGEVVDQIVGMTSKADLTTKLEAHA
ncbi:MAG: thioredoxin [Verrucomicrobiota bacterium]